MHEIILLPGLLEIHLRWIKEIKICTPILMMPLQLACHLRPRLKYLKNVAINMSERFVSQSVIMTFSAFFSGHEVDISGFEENVSATIVISNLMFICLTGM